MEYVYEPSKLQKIYENESLLKKKYNKEIAENMMKFLGTLMAAENAYDIKSMPQFYLEHKKGNLKKHYSVSLDKKKKMAINVADDR